MLEELKAVVEDMEEDKAPGLDSFSTSFITSCWDIIHKGLFKMVLKSQNCNKIWGSTNSTFLALNPKEKDATTFDRFWPISLCNIGYKIITKIMAIRIKGILHKIIPVNQGAFIEGRKIWDNIILVQEAIHSCLWNRVRGMVVKIDIADAFDRVRHAFLLHVMRKFGFNPAFIRWVKDYISEPWIAPLINGRVAGVFKTSRGLCQRCPISYTRWFKQ